MKFANMNNVDNTARFIAGELITMLDRKNAESHMSRRIREACPDYPKLTNAETALAKMLAMGPGAARRRPRSRRADDRRPARRGGGGVMNSTNKDMTDDGAPRSFGDELACMMFDGRRRAQVRARLMRRLDDQLAALVRATDADVDRVGWDTQKLIEFTDVFLAHPVALHSIRDRDQHSKVQRKNLSISKADWRRTRRPNVCGGIIKVRDIQRYIRSALRSADIKDILRQLSEAGFIEWTSQGYRRRL